MLEINRQIDAQCRLSDDPIDPVAICTRSSIESMHREVYTGTSHKRPDLEYPNGEVVRLVRDEFRDREGTLGQHRPPSVADMRSHMNWIGGAYRLDRIHSSDSPTLAATGAHHRLMWIYPFLDGNGHTGRLFIDQYLSAAGLAGCGLWSFSRGFGCDVDAY